MTVVAVTLNCNKLLWIQFPFLHMESTGYAYSTLASVQWLGIANTLGKQHLLVASRPFAVQASLVFVCRGRLLYRYPHRVTGSWNIMMWSFAYGWEEAQQMWHRIRINSIFLRQPNLSPPTFCNFSPWILHPCCLFPVLINGSRHVLDVGPIRQSLYQLRRNHPSGPMTSFCSVDQEDTGHQCFPTFRPCHCCKSGFADSCTLY